MKGIGPNAQLYDAERLGLPQATATGVQALGPAVDWWTAFGDPQLDRLVARALAAQPNLRVAGARVASAWAGVDVARSAEWPQVSGQLDLNRQKFSSNYIYPAPLGGSVVNMGNLQVGAGWELDFFGRNSSQLVAALGHARAAEAEHDAAPVLLASNVVRAYLQWARLLAQKEVAERMLDQREQMLGLVHERVKVGLDNQLEVRQNETGRADTRTSIAALNQQIDASRNALAARAQFYPNINLAAFVGLQSIGFDQMFKSGSLQWGVGPAIKLPIFEGGRLRAQLRGKSADADAAIEIYNATVIEAMREVADQSQGVHAVALQQQEQGVALRAAEGAYDIAQQRYKAGLGTYLQVLSTETAVLAQRRQQVDLAAQALLAQVGLAQALGGGWQPTPGQAALAQDLARAH